MVVNNPLDSWRRICKSGISDDCYWIRLLDRNGNVLGAVRSRYPIGSVKCHRKGTARYWELWEGDMSHRIIRIILAPQFPDRVNTDWGKV